MAMDEFLREAATITFHALDEGGRLVGVVGHQRVRDVTLLRHLYVATAHQRRGLGSQLLRQVVELTATPRLLVGMWADAVWAVRFYARHGFVPLPDSDRLLRSYWTIPARQREASLVMGREMSLSEA
jgi:GNAT superfamily N-acetyltransferase